jgi:NADH:ubiquinone oxidoreductase subunit 2 (subunit N)
MFIGTLGALNQNKIKRLFAYSSIAHVGYLLLGLATGTIEAVESILIYIIIYAFTALNIWGVILVMSKEGSPSPSGGRALGPRWRWAKPSQIPPTYCLRFPSQSGWGPLSSVWPGFAQQFDQIEPHDLTHLKASQPLWDLYQPNFGTCGLSKIQLGLRPLEGAPQSITSLTRIKKKSLGLADRGHIKYITDLSSLSKTNPILAITFAVLLFSNAGVPPLAGFYGKLNVFLSAIDQSMYFLAIAGIICSVMGAFYSIRLVKIIYYQTVGSPRPNYRSWNRYKQISKPSGILLAFTFFFITFFFLYPSFLFITTHLAALSLSS